MSVTILTGDCRDVLKTLPDASVNCCVTSPPYWGLRDYQTAKWEGGDADCDHKQEPPKFNGPKQTTAQVSGHASKAESHDRTHCHKCGARRIDSQIGLERTPEEYVAKLVAVFREVRRVLRDDGVLFLNLGDSYYHTNPSGPQGKTGDRASRTFTAAGAGGQRVQSCDTSGKAGQGLQGRGSSSQSRHDEHTDAWWSRIDDTDCRLAHEQAAELFRQILASMEELRDRLPIVDSVARQQIRQCVAAMRDQAQIAIHAAERLLSFPASMIAGCAPQLQDGLTPMDTLSVFLSSLQTFAACALRCAGTSGEPEGTEHGTAGNALLFAELAHHIRCTSAYSSLVVSWLNAPYVQAQCTTGAGWSQALKPKDLVGIPWSVARALQSEFYTGRIINERDRIWMAATIDAEGSICGFHHTRKDDGSLRTGIHITITNTNKVMLDNAYRIWPTSRQDHNFHGRGHLGEVDCWRWIAHDVDDKAALLRELYPYLLCKQKQALLAWNFLELSKNAKRLGHSAEANSTKEKRSWIVHSLTRLNHFGSVDIPKWIVDPPTMFEPGYYLRSDIIWNKKNPMPESVTDRPTRAHEYLFLMSKSKRYYYDAKAIAEPANGWNGSRFDDGRNAELHPNVGKRGANGKWSKEHRQASGRRITDNVANARANGADHDSPFGETRNKRSVWTVATRPYKEAHFATFPPNLIRPCVLAGCPQGGTVLDPFGGSGTTGMVAEEEGRNSILIELNPKYVALAEKRTAQGGLLCVA